MESADLGYTERTVLLSLQVLCCRQVLWEAQHRSLQVFV